MKNERFDIDALPKVNPFKVPEGYFDTLPTAVMERIRQGETKRRTIPLWPRLAIAAVLTGLIVTAGLFAYHSAEPAASSTALTAESDYAQDELEWAMIDNAEIEMYLAEAE